jgi:predicted HAD superfamily Cof-like phosphohydrolase
MEYRETPTEMVAEFMLKFEPPQSEEFWITLVREELTEAQEAAAHLTKEMADLVYVICGLKNSLGPDGAAKAVEKAGLSKELSLILFLSASLRPIMPEAFRRVHASNMSKLDDNGQVIRREDGKVMKGPNYKPPVLDDLIAS